MKKHNVIEAKLEAFISKYYKNKLLRGLLFFVAIGVSYFLLVLLIEYFFWLRPAGRAFLFWSFVLVELFLLYRFIGIPAARLFKLTKGIDFREASYLIGAHFPEVSDKLTNTLQLKGQGSGSDLAMASIAQKEKELDPIPFSLAINYRKNAKYLKYAVIPLLLFVIINFVFGKPIFKTSYERMVNYDKAYAPPAPFSFLIDETDLSTIENKDFTIHANVAGSEIPENVQVFIDGNAFYMTSAGGGKFSYRVEQPATDIDFHLEANDVRSRNYKLSVVKAPLIVDFEMALDYPAYTSKKDETVENTGNLTVPEGTRVTWNLQTLNTEEIKWITSDSTLNFKQKSTEVFSIQRTLSRTLAYGISTSNAALANYETLDYRIDVIRDAYPTINVSIKEDTVNGLQNYHQGRVSDDYGLRELRLVYYEEGKERDKKSKKLDINDGNVDQFIAAFPDTLNLIPGTAYTYYFEVTDNDAVNKYKSVRSNVFNFKKLTKEEVQDEQLDRQQETIKNLDKSLEKREKTDEELKKIAQLQKEKQELNYSEQQQLKSFINKQRQQDALMKKYSERLKENLRNFREKNQPEDKLDEQLQERLEQNEEKLEEQEKLLKELDELREKISKEELSEKLEKVSQQNKNSKKTLKQLLELTKKYYVEQKMKRIAEQIKELGEKQQELSKKEDNSPEKQEILNQEFKEVQEDLENLDKENEELTKPVDLPKEEKLEEEIIKEQQDATEELKKEQEDQDEGEKQNPEENKSDSSKKKAVQKQQKAADKMKQLAQKMESQMNQAGAQTLEEDVDMLRQILDNLVLFSFNQEDLMLEFKEMDDRNPMYSKKLVQQNVLRENFEHIDDSLFALSLRLPQLGEKISEELTNVDYNLGQSLERLAENQIMQGAASQQYVVTGANTLADMLSSILNNMQQQLSGSGSGKGGKPTPGAGSAGEQLSDIIMSQEELSEKMGKGESPGKGGKKGEKGEDGDQVKQGESGKDGEEGGNGESGKNGGSGGSQGQNGMKEGDRLSEEQRLKQYEIFKEQQQIREQLENLIQKEGLGEDANNLVREMRNLEDQLLSGGIDEAAHKRMQNLKHELMKLKVAEQEQGQDEERESQSNRKVFDNSAKSIEKEAKNYFNTEELLNREPLPLNGEYKIKVQSYFNGNDD
ncbi:DUF4175 family protein [Flavimarina sp. Hel_I_48]|uniref:DUF4175 family protein n=1 Tax=Flavimarina sp. Hel_I_48 TaxID=1392488 RepID=UPI0004DFC7D7|nr:DUF4175 family protein [Flavimarina sp. Hel_I_48]